MNIQAEKYTLIEELMKIDDIKLVNEIKEILQNRNEIVGYQSKGEPISRAKMQTDIVAAKKRIMSGQYITQQDLENEAENWK